MFLLGKRAQQAAGIMESCETNP